MKKVQNAITAGYLFLMLVIFPLYFRDHYLNMAFYKWIFYLFVTLFFLGLIVILMPMRGIGYLCTRKKVSKCEDKKVQKKIVITDCMVIAYGVANLITFFSCSSRQAAWMGTDSWYMGLIAQLLFVITYLVFSFGGASEKVFIGCQLLGTAACFLIAVCQRYGNDFLHLYWGMADEIVRDYLSTIGNRSWFAGYVSAVFPMGLYFFWITKKRRYIGLTGVYWALTCCCIVTMNTDSIYLSLAAVLLILILMSIGKWERMQRMLIILDVWAVSCLGMAFLRQVFPSTKIRILRGLSKVFLNMPFAAFCTVLFLTLTVLCIYCRKRYPGKCVDMEKIGIRKWQIRIVIVVGTVCLGMLLLMVLNSTGILQRWFGVSLQNYYLYFDDQWGDSRGFSWRFAWEMYLDFPLKEKLFGVGQDCFAYYAYSIPEYAKELRGFWGNAVLANAHNEWLNSLICNGFVGGILYLGSFVSAVYCCFSEKEEGQESDSLKQLLVKAIGLCIIGYMVNNLLGYQQASATAVIFIAMGVAMHLKKNAHN